VGTPSRVSAMAQRLPRGREPRGPGVRQIRRERIWTAVAGATARRPVLFAFGRMRVVMPTRIALYETSRSIRRRLTRRQSALQEQNRDEESASHPDPVSPEKSDDGIERSHQPRLLVVDRQIYGVVGCDIRVVGIELPIAVRVLTDGGAAACRGALWIGGAEYGLKA